MGQCEQCKIKGCGMCNVCRHNKVDVCKQCADMYQNYLARINANVNAGASVGINVTFGTVMSIFFIALVIYLIMKK
jgi:hypothetical protein